MGRGPGVPSPSVESKSRLQQDSLVTASAASLPARRPTRLLREDLLGADSGPDGFTWQTQRAREALARHSPGSPGFQTSAPSAGVGPAPRPAVACRAGCSPPGSSPQRLPAPRPRPAPLPEHTAMGTRGLPWGLPGPEQLGLACKSSGGADPRESSESCAGDKGIAEQQISPLKPPAPSDAGAWWFVFRLGGGECLFSQILPTGKESPRTGRGLMSPVTQ